MNAVTEGKKDETDLTKLGDVFFRCFLLVAFFPNYSKMNEKQQIKQTKHSSCLNMGPLKKTKQKKQNSGRVVGGVTQPVMNCRYFAWITRDTWPEHAPNLFSSLANLLWSNT